MIEWIPQLKKHEFPGDVTSQMEPELFNKLLFPLRKLSKVPMTPSPLIEGHVRKEGTSHHSLKNGTRKSDATDIFIPPTQTSVSTVLRTGLQLPIGGFGLYFDTSPSVMFHIDMRPKRLLWLRVDGEYIYEVNSPLKFYTELSHQLSKLEE